MKKRLLLCALFVLLLSLTTQALAVDQNSNTRIDALCSLPEIQVTVPATAEVYINPFEIPVEINSAMISQQIISTPAAIENKSKVPLSVEVTLTGELWADSDMRLLPYSTKGATSKAAFVYFEIHGSSGTTPAAWDEEFDAAKHAVLREGEGRPVKNIAILDQADKPNHFGAFRLTGDCVPSPRFPWTDADGLNAKIAFTFIPLSRDHS